MGNDDSSVRRRQLLAIGAVGTLATSGCLRLTEPGDASQSEPSTPPESGEQSPTDAPTTVSESGETTPTDTLTEAAGDRDSPPSASVEITDQETDGTSVTVAGVETGGEAIVQLYDRNGDFLANPGIRFQPGETREDITIDLEEAISETQTVGARVYWCEESGPSTCNGPAIARDSATVTVV